MNVKQYIPISGVVTQFNRSGDCRNSLQTLHAKRFPLFVPIWSYATRTTWCAVRCLCLAAAASGKWIQERQNNESRWLDENVCTHEKYQTYINSLARKCQVKRPLGRHMLRWGNIKFNLKKYDIMVWIGFSLLRIGPMTAFVKTTLNLRFPCIKGHLLTCWTTVSFTNKTLLHGTNHSTWTEGLNHICMFCAKIA
jgi:hypothetical protein